MKIYTKTGDKGQTSLYGGKRVSKTDLRVEAYGTLDELNAFIGYAKSLIENPTIAEQLAIIQSDVFTLSAEMATPSDKITLANGKPRLPLIIENKDIAKLEKWIDIWQENLPPLQYFILPSGGLASSSLHICRTITRRAERISVALQETESLREELLQYLNRLSDYFFVIARIVAKESGNKEEYWIP